MQICGEHGQRSEIAYEDTYCPACEEIADLKGEIQDLKQKIHKYENEEE